MPFRPSDQKAANDFYEAEPDEPDEEGEVCPGCYRKVCQCDRERE